MQRSGHQRRISTFSVQFVARPPEADPGSTDKPTSGSVQGKSDGASGRGEAAVGQGVYVISVAARLLEMHPQTLRKYERLGLITPTRSLGMLRLYSAEDVVRVRLIKHMVDYLGMNLAGVEFALNFLNRIMDLRQRLEAMSQPDLSHEFMVQELEGLLWELVGQSHGGDAGS